MARTEESAVGVDELTNDAEVVKVPDDDNGDRIVEGTIDLDRTERLGVQKRLRPLKENCRAKWRKIQSTVAEAFQLAQEVLSVVKMDSSTVAVAANND